MNNLKQIAFGGGCHWCTEAVFQSLIGVAKVEQGFISSNGENSSFSEAVIVYYNPKEINLSVLIEIHLLTHKSTSQHSMREKYRSAVYVFSTKSIASVLELINTLQQSFNDKIITQVIPFKSFKPSEKQFQNYYLKNPKKPFCKTYIEPKLKLLLQKFSKHLRERT